MMFPSHSTLIESLRAKPLPRLCIVCPVFNDFESADPLIADLRRSLPPDQLKTALLLLVNDGSSESPPPNLLTPSTLRVGILHLKSNLGHQRAIAVGLGFISHWLEDDATVVVMDADGEDRPQDLPRLLLPLHESPHSVVVANRARRREATGFRIGYWIYRSLFRLLTGRPIRNGNFSVMSGRTARRIAHTSGLWNHYAATLQVSKIPIIGVDVDRGPRYRGHSKMNAVNLIVHGLSAISVHMDVAGVRMLVGALLLTLLSGMALLGVVLIRFTTGLAIPGWASVVGSSFMILAALGVFAAVQLVFTVLASRDRPPVIAALESAHFIERLELSE